MESKVDLVECRVAGVSFRPDSIEKVKRGDPVALMREPSNKYDENAVRVLTLAGEHLGYVPRTMNEGFRLHELVFGKVTYVGRDETRPDSTLGMKITSYPQLMSPSVSPVPAHQESALKDLCGPDLWSRMCSDAINASNGSCQVTAAPPTQAHPLEFIPVWRLEEGFDVGLVRLALVSHEIASAHRLLDLEPGSEADKLGRQALMFINRWSPRDLDVHLTAMKLKRDAMIGTKTITLPSC